MKSDPDITHPYWKGYELRRWMVEDCSGLTQTKDGNDVVVDLPDYDIRKGITTSDPAAVMECFKVNIRFILPRPFGFRMCTRCPRCIDLGFPCANKFGNSFEPWGGIAGMTAANGCVVEYQHNNNPHAHGNAHLVSAYQHRTLEDIKVLIEKKLLDPE